MPDICSSSEAGYFSVISIRW